MSVHAMSWVFQHSKATGAARLVLLALADHAGLDNEECFPSTARLAQWTQLSERGVQKALAELRDAGRIEIAYGDGRNGTNRYRLTLLEEEAAEGRFGGEQNAPPPHVVHPTPPNSVHPGGELSAPKPSKNHKELKASMSEPPKPRPDVDTLCLYLADKIEGNGSKRPTVTKGWRDACRLMIDNDKRTVEQVRRAIDWCQADEFWRVNILSMSKLRAKFDVLRLAAERGNGTHRPVPNLAIPEAWR